MDRFPCLATFTPAPATTNEAAVEILNVPRASPPVPHISMAGETSGTGTIFSLIALAKPAISSTVSPLVRNAIRNPAIWASLNFPDMIESITSNALSCERSSPSSNCSSICFIISSLKNYELLLNHFQLRWIPGGTGPRKQDEIHVQCP